MNFLSMPLQQFMKTNYSGCGTRNLNLFSINYIMKGGILPWADIFIFIPIIGMALFYFLWQYPYARLWHWLVWLAVWFFLFVHQQQVMPIVFWPNFLPIRKLKNLLKACITLCSHQCSTGNYYRISYQPWF
jgi:hypothetical protein